VEHEIGEERRRWLTAVNRGAPAKWSSGENNRNAVYAREQKKGDVYWARP
jgi:hypothetical protein